MRWGFLVFALAAPGATLFASGCASAPAAKPDLDRGFARIQQYEAEIGRAEILVQRPDTTCDLARQQADAALAGAAALCQVARELSAADALTSCARAQRAAQGVAAHCAQRCPAAQPSATSVGDTQ